MSQRFGRGDAECRVQLHELGEEVQGQGVGALGELSPERGGVRGRRIWLGRQGRPRQQWLVDDDDDDDACRLRGGKREEATTASLRAFIQTQGVASPTLPMHVSTPGPPPPPKAHVSSHACIHSRIPPTIISSLHPFMHSPQRWRLDPLPRNEVGKAPRGGPRCVRGRPECAEHEL